MDLQAVYKKYNDYVFRLAVTHLFSVGVDNIKRIDIDAAEKECIENTPENHIMTGEFRAQLMRCAYDLAQIPMWDILKFIQMEIKLDNATVHPGVFVQFRSKVSDAVIANRVLSPETTEFDLDEVVELVTTQAHGSECGFRSSFTVDKALKEKGFKTAEVPFDHIVYI